MVDGSSGAADEDLDVLRALRSSRLTMDMERAPLTAVIDYVREMTGLNIHITGIDNPDQLLLSFKSEEQAADSLLRQLLHPHKLAHAVRDGVVLITTARGLIQRVKLELYDVQDLLCDEAGEELISRIVRRVQPGEWKEADGRTLQLQNGLLVVRTTAEGHRALGAALRRIRAGEPEEPERAPAEAVAADFRMMSDDAERRLAGLGERMAEALTSLACKEASGDLDARLQARTLLRSLESRLGLDRIRSLLAVGELDGAVREFRELWRAGGDLEDFAGMVCRLFGRHAKEARFIPRAVVDPVLITPTVGLQLWSGDAILIVRDGRPVAATPEEWLSPKGGTLIFTLPQELGDRLAGEGPACVIVELAR